MRAEDDLTFVTEILQERRQFRRIQRSLPGRVYFPGSAEEAACTVEDISAGGAKVICALNQPASGQVILYAGAIGRIEGHVVSAENDCFTMLFSCSRKRRDRLVDQLTIELNRHLLNGANHSECVDHRTSDSDG